MKNDLIKSAGLFLENIAKLIDVKTLMTIASWYGMLMLLSGVWVPAVEIVAIFSSAFGSINTFFFTKKDTVDSSRSVTETVTTIGPPTEGITK